MDLAILILLIFTMIFIIVFAITQSIVFLLKRRKFNSFGENISKGINDGVKEQFDSMSKNISSNIEKDIALSITQQLSNVKDVLSNVKDELNKNNQTNLDSINKNLKEGNELIHKNLLDGNEKINKNIAQQESNFKDLEAKIIKINNESIENLNAKIDKKLLEITNNNDSWYKTIKENIDSHFEDKLTKHIKEQFNNIKTSMDEMNQGMTKFETVQKSVMGLEKVFNNNKTVGLIGEFSLSQMLQHHFPNLKDKLWFEQYSIDPNTQEKVDFVIKSIMNEKDGELDTTKSILIPIDSKFHLDIWKKFDEEDDPSRKAEKFKALRDAVKKQAKDIADKYIKPNKKTTPYAIMYIPAETIYLTLIKEGNGFIFDLYKEHYVQVLGPTNILAFIYSIFMQSNNYHFSQQIDKIRDLFLSVQSTYEKLVKSVSDSAKSIDKAKKSIITVKKHSDSVLGSINKQASSLGIAKKSKIDVSFDEEYEDASEHLN
ncbi:DNA recombination protein [Mycoplasmopsis bovigenitalium]|uniref:DNA recombination protein RmuC n=1 Tax=Mycoplasmopsis bovigenitalium TaxID=2112 RepID=UPI00090AF3C3|nr:DNA recombination protein RmuC [Mycoplasmopsis bovigenitalium]BAW18589.1 DNA recombination protein [Mycoplasmopsis bovigenitalium]